MLCHHGFKEILGCDCVIHIPWVALPPSPLSESGWFSCKVGQCFLQYHGRPSSAYQQRIPVDKSKVITILSNFPSLPKAYTNDNNHLKAFSWETWAWLERKSIVLRTIIVRINHRYLQLLYCTIITNIYATLTAVRDCIALAAVTPEQRGRVEKLMKPEDGDDRLRGSDSPTVRPRCIKQPLPAHVTTATHSELQVFLWKKRTQMGLRGYKLELFSALKIYLLLKNMILCHAQKQPATPYCATQQLDSPGWLLVWAGERYLATILEQNISDFRHSISLSNIKRTSLYFSHLFTQH